MKHTCMRALVLALALAALGMAPARIRTELGIQADGAMSARWHAAIVDRHDAATLRRLEAERRTLQPAEQQWMRLVQREADGWSAQRPALDALFDGVPAPQQLSILFGNIGGNDGFTLGDDTICMDLRDLVQAYGSADGPENAARVRRFLSHEYVHLMAHRWRRLHQVPLETPLQRAWWALYNEGLGNYFSLSSKWLPVAGSLPPVARAALAENVPILQERLRRFARATPEQETELMQGLSIGPFPRKWGALTIALWLAEDAAADPDAVRRFAQAGPAGIADFVARHRAP